MIVIKFSTRTDRPNQRYFFHTLTKNVDEDKIVKIIPNTLRGFFEVCFLLDVLDKQPEAVNEWLANILSYISEDLTSEDLYKIVYSMDFLYTKASLQEHELTRLVASINSVFNRIASFAQIDGSYRSDINSSPLDETRNCLFAINLLEDLSQDILHYYKYRKNLKTIEKIYQTVPNVTRTSQFIQNQEAASQH